jgi:hypothetical protein
MKKIITTLFVVMSTVLFGQGFTYSYVDPCSRQIKTLQVTNNQAITVNYLGNINSFSSNDFINGNFDLWVNQITAAVADQPCDELLTNTQVSQNMFITQNLISTLTSITASSTMTASNAVANSVSSSTSSRKNNREGNKNNSNSNSTSNNQNNSETDGTNNNTQGNTSNGSTTQGGGTQQRGNSSSGSSTSKGNNTQGGTNNKPTGVSQGGGGQTQRGVTGESAQTNPNGTGSQNETSGGGNGGTTNSVANAAEATSSGSDGKGGSKPKVGSLIGVGDIVAIRVNEDKSNQFRGTMSVTKSNTNNTRAKGVLLNYTTTVNNSNLTFYGAFSNKKRTNTMIVANSSMIDFERNFFNTTTALDSKTFGKTSIMGGLNFTVGGLGGETFANISAVGGGFHPFKLNKNLSGNLLVLGVYSPFTQFYEGKWWDSGWLMVPFSSWDYTISKNFKYNVSFSGVYQVQGSILQFQILTGGKILL